VSVHLFPRRRINPQADVHLQMFKRAPERSAWRWRPDSRLEAFAVWSWQHQRAVTWIILTLALAVAVAVIAGAREPLSTTTPSGSTERTEPWRTQPR
jgi:hypothetical protein